jgi:hypothetical protein
MGFQKEIDESSPFIFAKQFNKKNKIKQLVDKNAF